MALIRCGIRGFIFTGGLFGNWRPASGADARAADFLNGFFFFQPDQALTNGFTGHAVVACTAEEACDRIRRGTGNAEPRDDFVIVGYNLHRFLSIPFHAYSRGFMTEISDFELYFLQFLVVVAGVIGFVWGREEGIKKGTFDTEKRFKDKN